MPNTLSEENYLKAIYHIGKRGDDKASATSIAEALKNNPASVIVMIKKLVEKKLIQYDKTKGAKLTEKGLKVAYLIVRRHRLWEVFLHDSLGYQWDEVHEIAEQLEHVHRDDLADRLDKFLGFPEYDPHGDPIPKSDGKMPVMPKRTLAEVEPGKSCKVFGVKDTSIPFLRYLHQLNIGIGTKLKVVENIQFDGSMNLVIGEDKKATVSKKFIDNILVS
ncbi:MAG TPA: metal-dependent transcriptional regulator [Cyclobacteriaceae bacterium]|nr:metal-dependent transcriptional regulator [Cyclobacteriaceae bacterium]